MRKKSTYIVLLVMLFVFFIVMFALFGVDNIKKSIYNTTLIVGDNTIWLYEKKNWLNLTNNTNIQDLNWDEYKVFVNNEEFGNYLLWHDDKWYAFDKKKNAVSIDGNLLAYKANYNIPVYKFTEEEISDTSTVIQMLKENDVDINSNFTSSYKVSFDYDNDNEEEEFYVISNAFPMDNPEKIFSIVYMVDGDNIYPIYTDVSKNSSFNGCKPYFTSFLDVDNDKTYEFILSCSKYSVADTVDMLYKFTNNEFKIVISNQ